MYLRETNTKQPSELLEISDGCAAIRWLNIDRRRRCRKLQSLVTASHTDPL